MPIYVEYFIAFCGIWILVSLGYYLGWRGGQLYNAVVYSMAIGAYFSAYVTRDLGWPFSLALIATAGVGAVTAFLPSLVISRLPAFVCATATIAMIIVLQQVIRSLAFLGGAMGFFGIPQMPNLLPIIWVTVVVAAFIVYRWDHSRLGRALEVLFVDPDVAATLGINIYRLRRAIHVFGGVTSALAGAYYSFLLGTIYPGFFGFSFLLFLCCFLFIGGYTTMWVPMVFVPILWAIPQILPEAIAVWKNVIYASTLLTIIILRPEGVIDKRVIRAISSKSQAWLGQLTTRHK